MTPPASASASSSRRNSFSRSGPTSVPSTGTTTATTIDTPPIRLDKNSDLASPSKATPPDAAAAANKKRTRTRTGCLNCRRKKRKCDERRPACGTCFRRDEQCQWGLKISFRAENAQHLDHTHPSMRRLARRRPREFEILDVTDEVIRDYYLASPLDGSDEEEAVAANGLGTTTTTNGAKRIPKKKCEGEDDKDKLSPSKARKKGPVSKLRGSQALQSELASARGTGSRLGSDASPPSAPGSVSATQRQTDSAVANLLYLSQSGRDQDVLDPALTAAPTSTGPMHMNTAMLTDYMDHVPHFTPDGSVEDVDPLQNLTYIDLHATLRSHIIHEVRSGAPTRHGTPNEEEKREESAMEDDLDELPALLEELPSGGPDSLRLSKDEEHMLWRNWFDEVAPWLDKFDNYRHFQNIIPTMAPTNDHLKYSILAMSARQIERKNGLVGTDRSLALYQQAIQMLLPQLPTRSTGVIASCVILCVLEMMSCSPQDWRRHLDGCATLMKAVDINGFVGGVEQALFWLFARMDICGGLISSLKTLVPVSLWASKLGLDSDVALFQSTTDFADWANFSVYLVAQVIDLLALLSGSPTHVAISPSDPKYESRWLRLWKHITEWHEGRPAALYPVMTIPSSGTSPFPTILYSNASAISGNQLYHTSSLLMLQNRPPGTQLSPKPRSILWHARQICGISMSNEHHGAWTNAIQPLWIAGRCMSHPDEHKAILKILQRIERESGWGTSWRAEDLKEFWGDLGE